METTMQSNAGIETRSQIKRRLCRFAKTASVMDRPNYMTRKARAEKFQAKHRTAGKRSIFPIEV